MMKKSKILHLLTVLPVIAFMASCGFTTEPKNRPNIIFVMVDDMGFADLSCFGRADYQTRNIDAFVREGIRFNNAYAAAAVCTPTRVAFMTGKYPARNAIGLREPLTGSAHDMTIGLDPNVPTISSILQKNEYETALFGKWHLGVNEKFSPLKHGFDHFFGILTGAADYIDHRPIDRNAWFLLKRPQTVLYQDEEPVVKAGYLTDLITDYAIRFVKKNHTRPFFISLQFTSPHWPWQGPNDMPAPDSIPHNQDIDPDKYRQMVQNLDDNFGRLMTAIQDAGLEESTLIIFTSDNGGERFSDMGPYAGAKLTLWEGGIRVPAAVRWPSVIHPEHQSNQPVITMDWTATILDAASAVVPDSFKSDGISLLAHFKDPASVIRRKFYWRLSNRIQQEAFRDGNWKYLHTADGDHLFNLEDDPYEMKNLNTERNDKLDELKREFARISSEMLSPVVLRE